ncbi:homeobox-leucine zipper protein ROC8-like [Solanum pennellii]|uniref:Homeobox-leucine zipper protein ROC8-like n=1 Tax=Solanum pennellii TaxID=28526 RepID=A0ABM1HLV7_SOLPN|nr:homeobox-leucine zipper protein ROC8-like [Solanum pennellii]
MTGSGEEPAGEPSNSQNRSERHGQYQRHSMEQIQRLEAFFKKCPHPDEDQQKQLGREAGLDHKQVKFWFQNKRTQTKTQNERSINNALRKEKERFLCENKAMKEAMKNIMCPKCDGLPIGKEERERNLENMKTENQWLTQQYEKVSNLISHVVGRPFVMDSNLAPQKSTLRSTSNSSDGTLLNQEICGSLIRYPPLRQENNHNNNNVHTHSIMSPSPQEHDEYHHDSRQQKILFETAVASMNEMVKLWEMNDPFWVDSSSDRRCFIHREIYGRKFSNQVLPYQTSMGRIESSKDFGIVSMTAIELIHNFLDPVKWMNLFPTIVTAAKTIEVLDSGTWGGSIQLMYEKLHILSPLVEAREFLFIRCCRQLDATTWIMVDISYDIFNEIQSGVPCYSWKFPSGCVIQDMGNGQSKVTWVEHVQVYEKYQVNSIFRDLLCDREAYGAKRWIVTLQRMCERCNFSMGSTYPTRHDFKGVFHDPEGVKNTIQVSQRMVKSFFEILSMTDYDGDFPTSSQVNRVDRISVRESEEIIEPKGFIAIATASLWLPLSFQDVFNFFKDDKTRNQWDVLTGENNVFELDRVPTGTFSGNNITIIQPYNMHKEMLVLEETSIDEMGAFLVYAPIEIRAITSIVNGVDATKVPILPSGIIISPDGRLSSNSDGTANAQNGSILTVAFQILICGDNPTSKQQQFDVVASVHGVLGATILKIKEALGCSDL